MLSLRPLFLPFPLDFPSTRTNSPRCKNEISLTSHAKYIRSLYGNNDGDWLHGTRGASITRKLVRGCTGEYSLLRSYSNANTYAHRTHTHIRIHIYAYTYAHTQRTIRNMQYKHTAHTHTHTHIQHKQTHTHTHTHRHTHTHTHTHTHMHTTRNMQYKQTHTHTRANMHSLTQTHTRTTAYAHIHACAQVILAIFNYNDDVVTVVSK
jgi:hypothetical protein